jgi:isopentenyldiphosphate isomerase
VHIWIYNEKQEFLIQKRAPHLSWFPNRWATTTGSMVSGERDVLAAAYREVEEELSLNSIDIDLEKGEEIIIGSSIVAIFSGFLPANMFSQIKLNSEVSDVKWMKTTKIDQLRKENLFAEYSQETFDIVYRMIEKKWTL